MKSLTEPLIAVCLYFAALYCVANAQTVVQPAPVVVQPAPVTIQPPAVSVTPPALSVTPVAPAVVAPPAVAVAPAPVVVTAPQVYVKPAVVWTREYRPGPFGVIMWGHWRRQPVPGPVQVAPQYQQPQYRDQIPPPDRGSSTKPVPVGAVFVSRNWDERDNNSPGFWNHLCVYVGNGSVVESQDYSGVHEISFAEYRARPQHVMVIFPRTPELGQAAAARARSLLGLPYFRFSSVVLFPRPLERGLNCVTVVEASYGVRLRVPDDIFRTNGVFATSPPV
jgi:hypothetical protein